MDAVIEIEGPCGVIIRGLDIRKAARALPLLADACEPGNRNRLTDGVTARDKIFAGNSDFIAVGAYTGQPDQRIEVKCGIVPGNGRIYVAGHSAFPKAAPMYSTAQKWVDLASKIDEIE